MAVEIQPHEVIGFSQKHPQEQLYRLDTTAIRAPFGFFYMNPDVCSLIWKGSHIFYSLDEVARDNLPSIIERGWTQKSTASLKETALVTLILQTGDLKEYNLVEQEQYSQYKSTLNDPDVISFARYDITQTTRSIPIQYTFTAENPRWSRAYLSEIAIQLPRSQPWSQDLLEWVIDHHIAAIYLKGQVHSKPLANTISDLAHI